MMRFMLACGALVVALGSPPVGAAQGTFDGLVVGKITTQDG